MQRKYPKEFVGVFCVGVPNKHYICIKLKGYKATLPAMFYNANPFMIMLGHLLN
jgi:hypothetical protein